MIEGLTILKIRIIICLIDMNIQYRTVTHLSELFMVSKSTISRAVDWLEENNMIFKDGRRINLTNYGKKLAINFKTRIKCSLNWLISEDVPQHIAENDAMVIAKDCSDFTISAVKKYSEINRIRKELGDKNQVSGLEICRLFSDGDYVFPFVIYKFGEPDGILISMANHGFYHPCTLSVKDGVGRVVLRSKLVEHRSFIEDVKVKGSLQILKYRENGVFKDSGKENECFFFPASAINFVNTGERHIMQGNILLRMNCTAGERHMPESTAVFTIFFQ